MFVFTELSDFNFALINYDCKNITAILFHAVSFSVLFSIDKHGKTSLYFYILQRAYLLASIAILFASSLVRHPFSIFHIQLPEGIPGVFMRHEEGRPSISCAGTTAVSARRLYRYSISAQVSGYLPQRLRSWLCSSGETSSSSQPCKVLLSWVPV